jgi:hypothetical protein
MKTAISIPQPIYRSAEKLAQRLGLSRSRLYATALKHFLERHDDDRVTEQLNHIYETAASKLDAPLRKLQAKSFSKDKW